ncbi:39432_t:CDS:2 [Gigaspora margarita]|uniref:39432_t:CDS:1 n=1 Tax=Gigaspora margarita TaxID=4874 RepID=A0ABN7URV6_GIGMA|nr:39432_t:CDS:2 [Gigaspora margarita]
MEPRKESGGLVKYVIPSLNNSHIQNRIFDTSIDIEVKKIKKIHLDRVRTILNDIRDKNDLADLPDLPVDYTEFSANIDNLPGDDALPTGYKKIDVINFYNARRQRLVDKEFINDFRAVGEEATNFAKATINTYTSHGQTDTDLDALIINRKELDKVNDIIKQIKNAKSLSDLPAETDIDATKYLENKVPTTKNHVAIKNQIKDKKAQLGQDAAEITARNNAIQAKNRLITLINEAKIQPDLTDIEAELNKKPVVSSSELKNSDYKTEMINLVRNDSQRTTQKQEIIKKINQIRENKLEAVRQIISQAQNIFNKDAATKEELEKVINDLKILANASQDKAENKKLLIDLETKLSKITPPDPEKEEPKDPGIPTPPSSPISQEEVEKYGAEFANLKPTQQEGRKTIFHYDKNEAKKQARADLAYHEEHECGNNLEKPKIAIYFSPNQGGNEHADLTYAEKINESELTLEKDNQGEIYQEQAKPTDNKSVG